MSAELSVENLRKVFTTGRPAVDDVSFRVAVGEIVVLLGPSGCGKTTTLRSVAGLENPTSGCIRIGGKVVSRPETGELVPPRLREVGMVFQSYAVWPHMTVYQNVAYPLRHRKFNSAEIKRKVEDTLEVVGLSEYAQRSVVALSGGQMQRVALARSLVYQPQLLLLDEPLSNLDAKLRIRLRDDLRRIIKQTGVTALYVTHDQSEAVVLGDRIGVMRDGKMLQLASPADVYARPADLFVANFTGASNLLKGEAGERDGGAITVKMPDGQRLLATPSAGVEPGVQVDVALRPENLRLSHANGSDTVHAYRGRIVDRRYQGMQTIYDVAIFGETMEALELGTTARYAVDDAVSVLLPPDVCWAYPTGNVVHED